MRNDQWLGCELQWTKDGHIRITAERLIEKMCRLNSIPPHGKKTPIPPGWRRDLESHVLDNQRAREYRSILGTAMYVATTVRPDLAYATSFLGQFMATLSSRNQIMHWKYTPTQRIPDLSPIKKDKRGI